MTICRSLFFCSFFQKGGTAMIEEIINAIKQTEKEAEAMIRKAKEEADAVIEDAKIHADRIRKDAAGNAIVRAETDRRREEEKGEKELLKNERAIEEEIRALREQAFTRTDEAVEAVIRGLY